MTRSTGIFGEFLWDDDEKYPYAELLQREKLIQPARNWSALFQGRPTSETGDFFEDGWLVNYDEYPVVDEMSVYGASDFAVTADGGDYTCHIIMGLDSHGRLYLLDLWRRQTAADEWVERLCDLIRRWRPKAWGFGKRANKISNRPISAKKDDRALGLLPPEGISVALRQGDPGALNSGPNGNIRPSRSDQGAMVFRFSGRIVAISGRKI
jgi:hypothetical protein